VSASAPAPVQEDAERPVSACCRISAAWRGLTRGTYEGERFKPPRVAKLVLRTGRLHRDL